MENDVRSKKKSAIVFHSVWLAISLVLWIVGLTTFINGLESEDAFLYWILWGVLCTIPILLPILRFAKGRAHDGAVRGSNEYTASVSGNTVYVQNHPWKGAIFGAIVGLFVGILAGPVALVVYMLKNISTIVKTASDLKQLPKEQ